jgi:hypothetical protein
MITMTSAKVSTPSKSKNISGQWKWQRIILLIVLGYEAVGCLLGGSLLVVSPDGRLTNMPVELMHGFFHDFMIPGILLFGLGILNTAAFITVVRRTNYDWVLAGLAMGGLIIWFWIEHAILGELHWLLVMWGLPVLVGAAMCIPFIPSQNITMQKILLVSGVLSSLLYIAMNVFIPMLYSGYSSFTQTVSELSAIDAPTRKLWVVWANAYSILLIAFGIGVRLSAGESRKLRIAGLLIIVHAVIGIFWPPMHQREVLAAGGSTTSDTLHIVWTMITVPFFILEIAFGAAALGKGFRLYSIVTMVLLIAFGALTGMDASAMQANLPTPWMGVWERVNIGSYMIWLIVFAMLLLRRMLLLRLPSRTMSTS